MSDEITDQQAAEFEKGIVQGYRERRLEASELDELMKRWDDIADRAAAESDDGPKSKYAEDYYRFIVDVFHALPALVTAARRGISWRDAGETGKPLAPSPDTRPLLLQALRQSGAVVLTREVGKHLVAIVLPGEHEVGVSQSEEVWAATVDALTQALNHVRTLQALSVEELRKLSRGGQG